VRAYVSRAALVAAAAALVAGCGGGGVIDAPPARPTATPPAIVTRPAARGEIVVRAGVSPVTKGPYAFSGRYTVRFRQYAPEDPSVDFGEETSFTAALLPAGARGPAGAGTRLFEDAAASGTRRMRIDGRFLVDVAFGDWPFVIRFTPVR
jgi:hypothetical protein